MVRPDLRDWRVWHRGAQHDRARYRALDALHGGADRSSDRDLRCPHRGLPGDRRHHDALGDLARAQGRHQSALPTRTGPSRVFGRDDPPSGDGTDAATTVGVNIRRWPSLTDNVIWVLPTGSRVRTIRSGVFTNADEAARWFMVDAGVAGEGWVHSAYFALDR